MKQLLLSLALIATTITAGGQEASDSVTTANNDNAEATSTDTILATVDTATIGISPLGDYIKGCTLPMERSVYSIKTSPDGNYICVFLREMKKDKYKDEGEIRVYRASDMAFLWSHDIDYSYHSVTLSSNKILLQTNRTIQRFGSDVPILEMLDYEDGTGFTPFYGAPAHINYPLATILLYKNATSSKLMAYSLETGEKQWEAEVKHKYNWGWNNTIMTDSCKLLVANDDICLIDLKTGAMKTVEATTGVTDVNKKLLKGLAIAGQVTIAAAVGFQYFNNLYVPVGADVITSITSNIARNDSSVFLTDKDNVYCFDLSLNNRWTAALPKHTGAHASIECQDGKLNVLCYGLAYKSIGEPRRYGRPFIAQYDAENGYCHYFKKFSDDKMAMLDVFDTPTDAYYLFKESMAHVSKGDTSIVSTPWDDTACSQPISLVTTPTFGLHAGDVAFTPLYCDEHHLAVATKKNGIYNVTPQLEVKSQYGESEIYYALTYDDNYFCISDMTAPASFLLVKPDGAQAMRFADDTTCVLIAGGKIFAGSRDSLRWMQSK